eukprot:8000870-Pyramimonas_sp.AAC.1
MYGARPRVTPRGGATHETGRRNWSRPAPTRTSPHRPSACYESTPDTAHDKWQAENCSSFMNARPA